MDGVFLYALDHIGWLCLPSKTPPWANVWLAHIRVDDEMAKDCPTIKTCLTIECLVRVNIH
jgi:hypothetical protein